MDPRLDRWAIPLAAAACSIAAALPGALQHALYGDEVASARILVEPGLGGVLRHVRLTESTPPGWYVVGWLARLVVGDVASVRLLSVAFAAAAAALTAVWARQLLRSRMAAALAGALVALGSEPVMYAEQLRAYALVLLVSVAFGMLLVEAARRPRLRVLVALAAVAWLGTLTHYFFFFVLAAGAAWPWATRAPGARRTTVALAAALAGFLPWLPDFIHQHEHGRYRWIGSFDATAVAALPGQLFFGPDGLLYGLARVALTLALVAGAVALWWRRTEGSAVVALGLLPVLGAGLVWAAGEPIFDQRNLLPVAPFLAILVAAGVRELPPRMLPIAALAGVAALLAGAAYTQASLGRVAYDDAARALAGFGWTPRDGLTLDYPTGVQITSAMAWYLPGRPELAWAPAFRRCRTRFAIVQTRSAASWLARRDDVVASRELTYYDHPILGRPRGSVLVVRFRRPTHVRGAFFYVLGERAWAACRQR